VVGEALLDIDDAVFESGIEETGLGADALASTREEAVLGLFVCREVGDVVKHPAEFLVELFGRELAGRDRGIVFDEGEAGGKFAVAEAGLMEALASAGAAVEHVEMLAGAMVEGELWTVFIEAVIKNVEMSFDDVGDVAQEGGGALLPGFGIINNNSEGGNGLAFHGSGGGCSGFGSDFVAPDVGEADGFENVDFINDPADLGLPIDSLEDAAGGGGGDDVVGDTLDFHFRSSEAGEVSAEVEFDSVGHEKGGRGFRLDA